MLAVNGVINAGGGDAVCFQWTHTERLNEVEQRGLAAAGTGLVNISRCVNVNR
jgi:hypothetical protein